jgi:molecular chaperone Hsp33
MQRHTDAIIPFAFEALPVRGALIQLQSTWRRMQLGHDYVDPVVELLGHSAAATGLIAQSLKFDGTITLQISGEGLLDMLVVQCSSELDLRGMASAPAANAEDTYTSLVGRSRCAITVDAGAMEQPYQGIVEVRGDALADSVEEYYEKSAQVAGHMQLVADRQYSGGILLQQMPGGPGPGTDEWRRLGLLVRTLRTVDVRDGIGGDLLHKLFVEDDIRFYEPQEARFRCRCSQHRAEEVLRLLGKEEARDACEEQGKVDVTCEYCGQVRTFDAVDISRLFAEQTVQSSDAVH